ncbi:MAG TPA: hypothetical protein VH601_19300, partial [Bryobacteraceae bacterium]
CIPGTATSTSGVGGSDWGCSHTRTAPDSLAHPGIGFATVRAATETLPGREAAALSASPA